MKHSESVKNIAAALVAVQSKLRPLKRNAANPFFKSDYTDLAAMTDALYPLMTAEGLAVMQGGDGQALETLVLHTSGEWVSFSLSLPQIADPQKFTAAITYFRRSGLGSAFGAASEGEDDDGNAASHPQARPSAPSPANRPPAESGARPTPPAPAARATGAGPALLDVKAVDTASGEKDGKPWKRFTANFSDGTRASTFSESAGEILTEAKHNGTPVRVVFEKRGNFTNIISVEAESDPVPFGN